MKAKVFFYAVSVVLLFIIGGCSKDDAPGEKMFQIKTDRQEVSVEGDSASTTLFQINASGVGISRLVLHYGGVDTVILNELEAPFNLPKRSMVGDWYVVGTAGDELAIVLQKNNTGIERTLQVSLDMIAALSTTVTIHQRPANPAK